jgi:hypothetical protein
MLVGVVQMLLEPARRVAMPEASGMSLLWKMPSAKASPKAAFLLTSRPSISTLALYCQSLVSRIRDRGWSI